MAREYRQKGLFVAGADTGVGKTVVAAGLLRLARDRGGAVRAVKPIETGCPRQDGILCPQDGSFLREASGGEAGIEQVVPYRFSLPASPARAALAEKRSIETVDLVDLIKAGARNADLTVVEGAGGLMVPINGDTMMIDLAQRLGYPVVLAARTRLGTVNHTLLSLEALERRSIQIAAIVLSQTSPETGPEEEFTPKDIARFAKDSPVLVLPHLDSETVGDPARISTIMAESWPEEVINLLIGV